MLMTFFQVLAVVLFFASFVGLMCWSGSALWDEDYRKAAWRAVVLVLWLTAGLTVIFHASANGQVNA